MIVFIKILKEQNILFTELKPNLSFEYKMFEKPVKHRNGKISKGYSWCGGGVDGEHLRKQILYLNI